MILFFGDRNQRIFAVQSDSKLDASTIEKLEWLFGGFPYIHSQTIESEFVGPRKTMITPWSTNAVEITQNMGIKGLIRIEQFVTFYKEFDPMLLEQYNTLDQTIFEVNIQPESILEIEDIGVYNQQEGLALNDEEVAYLEALSVRLNRKLTDSEVFGFSQVNSEHCRHKIFNGTFVIDGQEKPASLFKLIKKTAAENPNDIVSAYKDNVAFVKGPVVEQFAPERPDIPSYFKKSDFESVISLKAETHNFPTTVEPFNGAATGSGGEIRDRLAGGIGSLPLAGTAVYMTAYSRLENNRPWERMKERDWLYQTPMDILIKASNGASDFGNKFGQPLISGSVFTFEHEENSKKVGFDKVIMLAGGIGYGKANQSLKNTPQKNDKIVILGGENYRIGMGGAAVSSADTGKFSSGIELNAVQRSNPEMQKRVANAIRGMVESKENPIVSIHDHGAGGHLNCLSELVEETGGEINLDKLPVGDPTLSDKEIIGNESQERMGIVISESDIETLKKVAERERAPFYEVGTVTDDDRFLITSKKRNTTPMNLALSDMFGSSPKTIMEDQTASPNYTKVSISNHNIYELTEQLLQLEAVGSKDWLTNKVDRCVTGRVAKQQTAGPLQLPLNNCGVMSLDYNGKQGVATSIGHAPVSALIDSKAGSRIAITESLTNLVWAPLEKGLQSVTLSANWMWPCNNAGEDARLYEAVEACSDFAIALGINIPTGKDSLSMKQKYPNDEVIAPGTVIISAAGHCNDLTNVIEPVLQKEKQSIYYINFSQDTYKLGGSSLGQILGQVGAETPDVKDAEFVKNAFDTIQQLIQKNTVLAGHDVGSGGLITTLLEMCFADNQLGATLDLSSIKAPDLTHLLFSENMGIVFQADAAAEELLNQHFIPFHKIGTVTESNVLSIQYFEEQLEFDIAKYRDIWHKTSYLLDQKQSGAIKAKERFENYKHQRLSFKFPSSFDGKRPQIPTGQKIKAAVIREKGSNSEREMAYMMDLAGFEVKDVHMTDLISGRETLEDVQLIVAVGGFSNSDVLGSAKGWAGAFKYNAKARNSLQKFFERTDTLSLGVCNGCQLFMELGLLHPNDEEKPKMLHNDSRKFECTFTSVTIPQNNSVMLQNLSGSTLGIWAAHGEGKFHLPKNENHYKIVGKYTYDSYPSNPNGSDYNTAMLSSNDGRHLVMMPHLERSIFPWNWGHYPNERKNDELSPWIQVFIDAEMWCKNH
ncbi:MAG: phosphoribosylformylglycinamidine synthase [Flavobacteriaceae bacterium]|nr:phosphoribosylformylglycinamidine synthase [Flavobacteriaceae bacterium]